MSGLVRNGVSRVICGGLFFLGTFLILFFVYHKSSPDQSCLPLPKFARHQTDLSSSVGGRTSPPLVLLWFWPEDLRFDLRDCKKYLDIDGCRLTDDRSLYPNADEVIIFHDAISDDLANLPSLPRPGFQRWMWLNLEPPANTRRLQGIDSLFNLSLSFRQDADIPVRYELMYTKVPSEVASLPLPEKKNVVCYIRGDGAPEDGDGEKYYRELAKHIDVTVYDWPLASLLKRQDYFDVIGSCKFHLAFENYIYRDYITEKLNGPLAVGTVPIVLGPPRWNYEDFVPGNSLIHVNDFPSAESLAGFLKTLDVDNNAYMRYFQWRKHFSARRHSTEENHKYLKAICGACDYARKHKEYRVINNLHKWYFG